MRERTGALWNSFRYWFGRRSLQSRLIAAYIFIILGPSLLVSLYSYRAINNTYKRDSIEKNSYLLQMEKLYVLNQIEAMERVAQMASTDKGVESYLVSEDDPSLGELIEFNTTTFVSLSQMQFNNPNIEHLRLFSSNKNVHELWPVIFSEDRVSMEPWFQKALQMEGAHYWSFQKRDPDLMKRYSGEVEAGPAKVSLLKEKSIPAGHHVGMVQVDMQLSKFVPKAFTSVQDNESQMMIADEELNLFTRTDHSFLQENPGLSAAVKERLAVYRQTGEWEMDYQENGNSFLLIQAPLEQIDASLVTVVSMKGLMKDISRTRNMIIGANIVFIFLVTVIAYIMNAFILKNLRRLTETMKKVRRGEPYGSIRVNGGGEVGELAHHFSKLLNTINTLVAQAVHKQALSKEAELRTLHNQIDAHFLYNTLENIKMLAEIENQRTISDALTRLGGMMRYNFKWTGEYVKLRDELRHIENYIEVMNIRFEHTIRLDLHIDSAYLEVEVLKMSLQPIVENSVKHAWNAEGVELTDRVVRIEVTEAEGDLFIVLRDNGLGLTPERLVTLHEAIYAKEEPGGAAESSGTGGRYKAGGVGLRNVHQRLQLFYGEAYGLEVQSEAGKWTAVYMSLPKVLLTGDSEL